MFKQLEPRTQGRNWDDNRPEEVRISVLAGSKKSLQANISIGKNIIEQMGWKKGDRIQIWVDEEKKIFSLSKADDGTGYKLTTASGFGNGKEPHRCLNIKLCVNRSRVSFITSKHPSTRMDHSVKGDGKELWINYNRR